MTPCALQRKTRLLTLFCLLLAASYSFAQRYRDYSTQYSYHALTAELGAGAGFMNCLTDLGGGKGAGKKFIKDINWNNSQPCMSGYIAFTYEDVFAVRLEATFGKVKAYDSILSKNKDASHGRYYRNLSFQSAISEYAAIAEFHPLMLKDHGNKEPSRFSPYLLGGIARFRFNPQTYFQGQWVDLQPLHLEGQGFAEYKGRFNYNLSATSYPVGLGLRYELGSLFYVRVEAVYRITSTDYLDDVSQERYIDPATFALHLSADKATMAKLLYSRSYEVLPGSTPDINSSRGYSTNNDSYFSFNLKVGLVLNRGRN